MKKYLLLTLFILSSLNAREQHTFWDTYTAALRGDKEAQFLVGILYEKGSGVEQNDTKAAEWFERSALQGHMDAQYNIGLMYASGRGVNENRIRAIEWFSRAADQGDQDAKMVLLKLKDSPSENKTAAENDRNTEIIAIPPTVIYTKENPLICNDDNICVSHKEKMVLTSIAKRGEYYKNNGSLSKRGWKRYPNVRWIHEKSVDHKK
jgi:hypothetical protein